MSEMLEYHICEDCHCRVGELDEFNDRVVCEDCYAELEDYEVDHKRSFANSVEPDDLPF